MDKTQLIDSILVDMAPHLTKEQLEILKSIMIRQFRYVEIESAQLPATFESNNEYYIEMFMALKGTKLSKRTMQVYISTLKDFMAIINKPLNMITCLDIEYFLGLKSKTCNEKTLNNYRRNLSAFYTWMRKKKFVAENPVDEIEAYKEVQKPIDHLEAVEKEQLKTGCKDARDRAIIEFLRCTAPRIGELINVKVSDVDLISGKVTIYGEKTRTFRTVYIDNVAKEYISKYLIERGASPDEYLFQGKTGEQLTISGMADIVRNIGKRAGMQRRVYVHLFRHTVATDIVRKGGSMADAGEYLGHKEETVTGRHYTFIDDDHIQKIFAKYVQAV